MRGIAFQQVYRDETTIVGIKHRQSITEDTSPRRSKAETTPKATATMVGQSIAAKLAGTPPPVNAVRPHRRDLP